MPDPLSPLPFPSLSNGATPEHAPKPSKKKKRKPAASPGASGKLEGGAKKGRRTLITLLLDRSGSMLGNREATLEAINGYVDGLRPLGAAARFSLIQFASAVGREMVLEKTCEAVPVADVIPLTRAAYQPSGGTPLLDAVMAVIDGVEDALRDRPGIEPVVAIQTDGQENASARWSWEQVRARIARKTEEGWQFVFLGAGLEAHAYEQSGRLGIDRAATMAYRNDGQGTRAAFQATADSTRAYALGHSAILSYSVAQKRAAGDTEEGAPMPAADGAAGAMPGLRPVSVRGPRAGDVGGWAQGPMGAPLPPFPVPPPFAPSVFAPLEGGAWDPSAAYVLPRRRGPSLAVPTDATKQEG